MHALSVGSLTATLAVLALTCSTAHGEQDSGPESTWQPIISLDTHDRSGLRRDTWYFLGYQWVTIGILYAAPESVSGWTEEQKESYDLSVWWDNVTHPQVDSDDFYINYILHPYWGAAYYVRARERGYDDMQAFWYSVLLSSAYEFGAEALFEEPSIQDIFVTPIFGSLVGQYFMTLRSRIRAREQELGYRRTGDKCLWIATDPLGALNRSFDRLTGRKGALRVRPYRHAAYWHEAGTLAPSNRDTEPVLGLEIRFEW